MSILNKKLEREPKVIRCKKKTENEIPPKNLKTKNSKNFLRIVKFFIAKNIKQAAVV